MAQVYSFTDENGQTRLLAEIHPDPAGTPFDGGTITTPLDIDVAASGILTLLDAEDTNSTDPMGLTFSVNHIANGQVNADLIVAAGGTGAAFIEAFDDSLDGGVSLSTSTSNTFTARTGTAGTTPIVQANLGAAQTFATLANGGIATAPPVPATQQLVTATGAQLSTTRDVRAFTPVTFNPGAATTATCLMQVSPDNLTYYSLGTETEPAGVAFDGTIHVIQVYLPAAWYVKLTVNAQAVLGTTTYY